MPIPVNSKPILLQISVKMAGCIMEIPFSCESFLIVFVSTSFEAIHKTATDIPADAGIYWRSKQNYKPLQTVFGEYF